MNIEFNHNNDSVAQSDNKSLFANISNQVYNDKTSFTNTFRQNERNTADLHELKIVDEKGSPSNSDLPLFTVSSSVLEKADIWGKDNLVTMGELATKMKSQGVSGDDFKTLDQIAAKLKTTPENENYVFAEQIGQMANKWNKGADTDKYSLEEMARLYVQFDQVARLDGNGNSVSRKDLEINEAAVEKVHPRAAADGGQARADEQAGR
jgi:hypothetical protein